MNKNFMLTKEYLLSPPSNISLLEALEEHLTEAGNRFISEVITNRHPNGFDIEEIIFECSLNDVLARAEIVEDSAYRIEFGRKFTSAILKMAEYVAPKLSSAVPGIDEGNTVYFAFHYMAWFVLNHEIAHVTHGHLNYIQQKGMSGYVEINNERKPLIHLHDDASRSMSYWRALESEADAYAISSSLPTYFYINQSTSWKSLSLDEVLFCHGAMVSLTFYLMNALAKDSDDFRHPHPKTRLYLTLPSIDSLAKRYGYEVKAFTEIIINAHHKIAVSILGEKVSVNEAIASAVYMLTLDSTIKEAGISSFRRLKRDGAG